MTSPREGHNFVQQTPVDDSDAWEDAPDPDEDDIATVSEWSPQEPHGHGYGHAPTHTQSHGHGVTVTYLRTYTPSQSDRGRPQIQTSQPQSQPQSPLDDIPMAREFQSMIHNMMGNIFSPTTDGAPTPHPDTQETSPTRSRSLPRMRMGTTTTISGLSGPGIRWTMTTLGGQESEPTSAITPATPGSGPFHHMLHSILRMPFGPGAGGETPGPLGMLGPFAMFAGLGDPANMQHGDAVFSQEALDRVISQLMEQTVLGSAPGPASNEAISSLPVRDITLEDLGQEGRAECSICMDDVVVGQQVSVLPCHHWFHGECVKAWLNEHDTCPHCRQSIMPKPAEGEDVNRLRTPHEEPRHDHTLGSPMEYRPNQSMTAGGMGNGSFEYPWVVDSPQLSRTGTNTSAGMAMGMGPSTLSTSAPTASNAAHRQTRSAGPILRGEHSGGQDSLFAQMRRAFGPSAGAAIGNNGGHTATAAGETSDDRTPT